MHEHSKITPGWWLIKQGDREAEPVKIETKNQPPGTFLVIFFNGDDMESIFLKPDDVFLRPIITDERIEVQVRFNDEKCAGLRWQAWVGHPAATPYGFAWHGETEDAAVGSAVRLHPEVFGISVTTVPMGVGKP